MKQILITSTVFLLLSVSACFGQNDWQPGYIIKNQGDTIYGFVENRNSKSNSLRCNFRKDINAEIQELSPQELLGFRFTNGKFYIAKKIDLQGVEKNVFLEFLISGRVNVYHFSGDNERFFIEKDSIIYELKNSTVIRAKDGNEYLIEKKEFLGMLNYLFDEAKIQNDINKCNFTSKSLIKIAKEYHDKVCTSGKCIIYEKNIQPVHISIGIYSGLSYNSISFGREIVSNYSPGSLVGVRFEFENLFEWNENVDIILDLTIHRFTKYKFDYKIQGLKEDVNVNTMAFKIPVSIIYNFSKGKIRPYMGIGIENMFILSQNKNFKIYDFWHEYGKSIPTYHIGLNGKLGSKYVLNNGHSIFMELSYEYSGTINVNEYLRFHNNLFSIDLGYFF